MNAATAYRQQDAHQANPIRLVVLLYEQLIKDLRRAQGFIDNQDIEGRTHEIDHALTVVGQLQGTLDRDKGGEVAAGLDRFYELLRHSLIQAQIASSKEILQKQIESLLMLREAWTAVEKAEISSRLVLPEETSALSTSPQQQKVSSGWKA
ncbi:MAG TPA: flagellar export chaperone FliS [Terriglobales bacterium]|jgi:flagellar protein FliS